MACNAVKLSAITTSCGSNIPSIKKLWVGGFGTAVIAHNLASDTPSDYADVTVQMDGDNPVLDNDGLKIIENINSATLKSGSDLWVEFGFRKNTCSATSEMTVNTNGSHFYTNSLNLVFARQDSAKRLNIQSLASGECACIYVDGNNNYWMLGLDQPVTLTTASATTGTAATDSNQVDLVLSEESAVLPIPLLASNAEAIITALTVATETE